MSADDYNHQSIRGCLDNLHEIRALELASSNGDDTPAQADRRQKLRDMLLDVESALSQLAAPLSDAIYWRYEEALTDRQAAQKLGICHKALQKRVARAETAIQKFLGNGRQTP
jgi:DNA-directed RNA polymerase specialized sigma24 family protein